MFDDREVFDDQCARSVLFFRLENRSTEFDDATDARVRLRLPGRNIEGAIDPIRRARGEQGLLFASGGGRNKDSDQRGERKGPRWNVVHEWIPALMTKPALQQEAASAGSIR